MSDFIIGVNEPITVSNAEERRHIDKLCSVFSDQEFLNAYKFVVGQWVRNAIAAQVEAPVQNEDGRATFFMTKGRRNGLTVLEQFVMGEIKSRREIALKAEQLNS